MMKQLKLIVYHWICRFDNRMANYFLKKFNEHVKRFEQIYYEISR